MKNRNLNEAGTNKELSTLVISSILITMFLFFIDEGYYNFSWMTSVGNWIIFFIYGAAIFIGQLLVFKFGLRRFHGKGKTLLSVVLGSALGLILLIGFLFNG